MKLGEQNVSDLYIGLVKERKTWSSEKEMFLPVWMTYGCKITCHMRVSVWSCFNFEEAQYHHTTSQQQTKYEYAAMIAYKYIRQVNKIGEKKIALDPSPS